MNILLIFTISSGFISGLSLMITGSTLNFWILELGLDKTLIGLFGMTALPYSINFLWMPLFDKIIFKKNICNMNYENSSKLIWLIFLLSSLSISTAFMAFMHKNFVILAILSFITAFFSSSKDGLLGGLKSDILNTEKIYQYSGFYVVSYRIGMFFASAVAIYLANYFSWTFIYLLFSIMILVFSTIICISWIKIKNMEKNSILANSSQEIIDIKHLKISKSLIIFIIFLITYKLSDNLISIMINAFLLEQNYSYTEIAWYSKTAGTCGAIFGGYLASFYMKNQINLKKHLIIFSLLNNLMHLFLILQSIFEKNLFLLSVGVIFGSIFGGMTMSCYMATIILKSNGKYKATKYAFYTSIMGLSRVVLPIFSGFIILYCNWAEYFAICTFLGFCSLFVIKFIKI